MDVSEDALVTRQECFDEGFQLGARVEHRVAVEAVAGALLDILGKDAGDGRINLGAAGWWARDRGKWVQSWEYDYSDLPAPASK